MRIGYPCINLTIGCKSDSTFRLKSYTDERLRSTIENNLDCLQRILQFNIKHDILYFRITSDLVPFASHPVCRFDWQSHFRDKFAEIGNYINRHKIRISMHPGQYTVLNSPDALVVERSKKELLYHQQVLDALGIDASAKIQIHIGGVYDDKPAGMIRFIDVYNSLEEETRKRLVIENDDLRYTLHDCMNVYEKTGIPVLFDIFHHELNSSGESIGNAFNVFTRTWNKEDGIPMIDYSSGDEAGKRIKHAGSIDIDLFQRLLKQTAKFDFDIMLEIKDKEQSALKAVKAVSHDKRFTGKVKTEIEQKG